MKKLAMIGGIGPESTILYYQSIIDAYKKNYLETGFPEIDLVSLNLLKLVQMAEKNQWDEMALLLSQHFNQMKNNGADLGVICSNTPHKIFDQIQANTDLLLLSILDVTSQYLMNQGFKKSLLLGTPFTMSSDFYQNKLNEYQIKTLVPDADEQRRLGSMILNEIELGIIKENTRQYFKDIIAKYIEHDQIDCVILGCTELPFVLKDGDCDVPLIDTAQLHIEAIVEEIRD